MVNRSREDFLLSRVYAALVGLWIGDGMGMPVEMMTPEQIKETVGRVTGFITPVQRHIGGTAFLPAGHWTDDWQLARAILRSLVESGGYNINDIVGQHLLALKESTIGWGKATKNELLNIQRFFETGGTEGRNPATSPQLIAGQGTGNGVAMKIAALALYQVLKQGGFYRLPLVTQVKEVGLLTHADPRASVAAFAVAAVIGMVMEKPFELFWPAKKFQQQRFLRRLIALTEWAEQDGGLKSVNYTDQFFSEALGYLASNNGLLLEGSEYLRKIGTNCFALNSVPFAIGVFLRHPTDFRAGVLEAINAGGDTDTTAAMVGAMIGANVGLEGIPLEWRHFLMEHYSDDYGELLSLGSALFMQATGKVE
ncbi:MAG: ADP-ribosylglycohydrolase family protein [Patescibacteria group bacterium]|jgi:ADP-ribosylglycohydrolase